MTNPTGFGLPNAGAAGAGKSSPLGPSRSILASLQVPANRLFGSARVNLVVPWMSASSGTAGAKPNAPTTPNDPKSTTRSDPKRTIRSLRMVPSLVSGEGRRCIPAPARPAAIVVRYAASNEIFVRVDEPHNGPDAREASARGPG